MSQQGRALISALNGGDYDAIDRIQLTDTDLKIVNHHIHEIFDRAVGGENLPLFDALLRIPNVRISSPTYCALRHATQLGLVEYIKRLEGHPGVNAGVKDKLGFTALLHALTGKWSEAKSLAMVQILVGFPNSRVNARNAERKTALHYAIQKKWFEVAEILLSNGAYPQAEDADGQTPTQLGMGMMLEMPDSLFNAMLSSTNTDDDVEEQPEEEFDPAEIRDEEERQEAMYNQMNSHKGPELLATNQDVDLTDPAPLSQSSPRAYPPVQPSDIGQTTPPAVSNPAAVRPDPPKAIDPLTVQQPSIRHTSVDVTEPPKPKKVTPPPATIQARPVDRPEPVSTKPIVINDEAGLTEILGASDLNELAPELTRDFFLSPSPDDPRFRLHRRAILERLEDINDILSRKGQKLRAQDYRLKDPITGFNLWHVAAATGNFESALKSLSKHGEWPGGEDFEARTEVGKSITDVLEDTNCLSGVLHSEIWNKHPRLLAALLAQLPPARRGQFASLVTRTNLLILHDSN